MSISDELKLIAAVLKGYPDSIAKADALHSVRAIEDAVSTVQEPVGTVVEGHDGFPHKRIAGTAYQLSSLPIGASVYAAPVLPPDAAAKHVARYLWLRAEVEGRDQVAARLVQDHFGEELDIAIDKHMGRENGST